jgi:hypothetical protein
MEPGLAVFIALNVVAGVAAIAGVQYARQRVRSQVYRLGLDRVGDSWRGVIDGLAVEVRLDASLVVVRPFTSVDYIGPHALRPFGPLVSTGDASFDNAMATCGDEAVVCGALDATARSAVVSKAIAVRYGQLEGTFASIAGVQSIVELATRLHHRLHCTPDERRAQLEENARRDPVSEVRLRCVGTLARVPGGLVRAEALARDESLDESVRAEAAIAAGSLDVLAAIAASTTDADRLAAVTLALGASGSLELSRALERIRFLVRDAPSESLVDALGRYGDVGDVPLLDSLSDARLRAAVRAAIRAIQGRVVGAVDGALALADSQSAGELAVADAGGLAVTRTAKGDPPS